MNAKLFYGLKAMPFIKETHYSHPFETEDLANVRQRLQYLKDIRGIGVFTGSPGCGKSSGVYEFARKLNHSLYRVIYITMTTVTSTELLKQIAYGLGLDPMHRKCDLFRQIQETVESMVKDRKMTPVLIIDEAQCLTDSILNDIKMLLNFDFDTKNYMILIFIGESSFNGKLGKRVHEALRQRVVINYDMMGLQEHEAADYVSYCMKECGCREPVFLPEAILSAWSIGNGSIRKMNNVLEKALIEGSNREQREIDTDIILTAQQEVELG